LPRQRADDRTIALGDGEVVRHVSPQPSHPLGITANRRPDGVVLRAVHHRQKRLSSNLQQSEVDSLNRLGPEEKVLESLEIDAWLWGLQPDRNGPLGPLPEEQRRRRQGEKG